MKRTDAKPCCDIPWYRLLCCCLIFPACVLIVTPSVPLPRVLPLQPLPAGLWLTAVCALYHRQEATGAVGVTRVPRCRRTNPPGCGWGHLLAGHTRLLFRHFFCYLQGEHGTTHYTSYAAVCFAAEWLTATRPSVLPPSYCTFSSHCLLILLVILYALSSLPFSSLLYCRFES